MSEALAGLTVLVTRPNPAGEALCQRIEAMGGRAQHYPVLAFAPPTDRALYLSAIEALCEQAWLIFISPQAVAASLPELTKIRSRLLPTVRFACVGAATAKALNAAGFHHVICPDADFTSEGLLALSPLQAVQGVKIAIIRGEGGRMKIDNELAARGALVHPVIAYRRQLPIIDVATEQATISALHENRIDVVLGSSFQSLQHLKQLLGEARWPLLKRLPVVVMSERIKTLAQDAGYEQVLVSPAASEQALINYLVKERKRLCQMKPTQ